MKDLEEGGFLAGLIKVEQSIRSLVNPYRFGRRPNDLLRIGSHHGLEEVAPFNGYISGIEKAMGCADGGSQSGAFFDLKGSYRCSENLRNDGEETAVLRGSSSDQNAFGPGTDPTGMQVHRHDLSFSDSSNVALHVFGLEAAEAPDSGLQDEGGDFR